MCFFRKAHRTSTIVNSIVPVIVSRIAECLQASLQPVCKPNCRRSATLDADLLQASLQSDCKKGFSLIPSGMSAFILIALFILFPVLVFCQERGKVSNLVSLDEAIETSNLMSWVFALAIKTASVTMFTATGFCIQNGMRFMYSY